MSNLATTDLIVPAVLLGVGLYVYSNMRKGVPRYTRFQHQELVDAAQTHWRNTVAEHAYIPLQWEGERPDQNVQYLRNDVWGQVVPLEDRGHAFSVGYHPGLTQDGRDSHNGGNLVDLVLLNDHRHNVSASKPGYPQCVSRGDAISRRQQLIPVA